MRAARRFPGGAYRIEAQADAGGMAVVYRAQIGQPDCPFTGRMPSGVTRHALGAATAGRRGHLQRADTRRRLRHAVWRDYGRNNPRPRHSHLAR